MTSHAIHWAEGLFLRPQHFQAGERNLREELRLSESWSSGYAYGLRRIEHDEEALGNWRISLRTCHARLHDGTHLRYPETANLAPAVVPKDAFKSAQDRVMVHVAVPRLQLGRKNAEAAAGDVMCRYVIDSEEVEDENEVGNSQDLQIRWLNARLVIGDEDLSGYDALLIMRLKLGATAEAPPEIDPDYIPPLLATDAWPILQRDIIEGIYHYLSATADVFARQMIDRGVAFESGHREDLERILKLHAMNAALGKLSILPYVRGVHPLAAYMELCHDVGLLAIFQRERRMPEVPRYDHDDLATCFYKVRTLICGEEVQPVEGYETRPFIGVGEHMRVRLEREWLEPNWRFYIGAKSNVPSNEVERLLTGGGINMKVGNSERVDEVFRRGQAGVQLTRAAQPPRDFPRTQWTYWKVDRRSEAWKDVEETLNLGIRFNLGQVDGESVDGDTNVRFKGDTGNLVEMSFTLYAMRRPEV